MKSFWWLLALALVVLIGGCTGMGTLPGNPHTEIGGKAVYGTQIYGVNKNLDGTWDVDNVVGGPGMQTKTKRIGDNYIVVWSCDLVNTNPVPCAYVCEIKATMSGSAPELVATEKFDLKPGETKVMTGKKVYTAQNNFCLRGFSMNPVSVKQIGGDTELHQVKTEVIPFKAEARADGVAPVKCELPEKK
jgi:hypothetical protein